MKKHHGPSWTSRILTAGGIIFLCLGGMVFIVTKSGGLVMCTFGSILVGLGAEHAWADGFLAATRILK